MYIVLYTLSDSQSRSPSFTCQSHHPCYNGSYPWCHKCLDVSCILLMSQDILGSDALVLGHPKTYLKSWQKWAHLRNKCVWLGNLMSFDGFGNFIFGGFWRLLADFCRFWVIVGGCLGDVWRNVGRFSGWIMVMFGGLLLAIVGGCWAIFRAWAGGEEELLVGLMRFRRLGVRWRKVYRRPANLVAGWRTLYLPPPPPGAKLWLQLGADWTSGWKFVQKSQKYKNKKKTNIFWKWPKTPTYSNLNPKNWPGRAKSWTRKKLAWAGKSWTLILKIVLKPIFPVGFTFLASFTQLNWNDCRVCRGDRSDLGRKTQ